MVNKAFSFPRCRRSARGMTLLEMMVAGTIFIIFATNFSGLWVSSGKQMQYVLDRARLAREAYTARTLLVKDLSLATSVTIADPPATGFNIIKTGAVTTYSADGDKLTRYDSVTDSSMTAAAYLFSSTPTLKVDGSLLAPYTFSKRNISVRLNVFWNKIP